jgi:hypothetical protein
VFHSRLSVKGKKPVAVAQLEEAWINGDCSRASAAPIARLALLRLRFDGWSGGGESRMGGEGDGVPGLLRGARYL